MYQFISPINHAVAQSYPCREQIFPYKVTPFSLAHALKIGADNCMKMNEIGLRGGVHP